MAVARNSAYSFAGMAVPVLVSIVTVPFYIAQIGADRYGALAIAWLILGYFGQADFGAGRAVMQRIASMKDEGPDKMASALWSALTSMIGFGAVGAIILFGFSYWYFAAAFQVAEGLRAEILSAVWLLALCTPLVFLNGVVAGALMGIERFGLVAIGQVVGNSCILIFPLLTAYFITIDLSALIMAAFIARALGMLIILMGAWHAILRGHRATFSKSEFARLARFGGWAMISALVGPLMVIADRFVIGAIENAAAVAAYAIPFQIASRLLMAPVSVVQALFPRFAAESDTAARDRCEAFTVFIALLFAPVIVGIICLSEPLLDLWLGAALDPRSIAVAQIVLLGVWFNAIAHVAFAFVQARGDPRFTGLLHLAELPFYAGLLFILGAQYGLAGFAAAYAVRCGVDCGILMHRAQALTKQAVGKIAMPIALLICAMFAANMLESWIALFVGACVLGLTSLAILAVYMPARIRERVMALPLLQRFAG